jgi:hypothetical protein
MKQVFLCPEKFQNQEFNMRIVVLTLIVFFIQPIPSFAKCKQAEICEMIKKLDHFSILNQCPEAAPMIKTKRRPSFCPSRNFCWQL